MNRTSKLIAVSLCLLTVHFGYAQNSTGGGAPASSSKETPKSCAPKPCPPKPCPPKPCKPCPPVCFERGYPDTNCCIPSAYNEPANFELSPCPWNFWIDASFTYWTAYQEGLDLAHSDVASTSGATAGTPLFVQTLFQDTKWEPGFKVGIGVDLGHDHWLGFAEYAWFRSRTTTSSGAPTGLLAGAAGPFRWDINNWELGQTNDKASSLSSVWRLRMDLLDVGLSRPYYQGTHLIVSPFGSVRAAWIRQNLRMAVVPTGLSAGVVGNTNAVLHNRSNSWALGPRGGLQCKWHLGWGFRFQGDVAGTIAFTRYTSVASRADALIESATEFPRESSYSDYNTIRFNNDMNVGLGWGDYFDCRNYHFDLLVSYDFQIFWNQNMMRNLVNQVASQESFSAANLYLQGLTVRAELDF